MATGEKETVLIIGATGNVGVSAAKAALTSGRAVLAIVRNETSANKLFHALGTRDGVTTVEANILSEDGVKGVVDQVKAGKLPKFQHVYSTSGGMYQKTTLTDMTLEELRENLSVSFEANFLAYRSTVPYLIEQNDPRSTWTTCTGPVGDYGFAAGPAMAQGAMYGFAATAARDNEKTNVRFNEVSLAMSVQVDEMAQKSGALPSSEFASVYELILSSPDLRSSRIFVASRDDLKTLRHETRIKSFR